MPIRENFMSPVHTYRKDGLDRIVIPCQIISSYGDYTTNNSNSVIQSNGETAYSFQNLKMNHHPNPVRYKNGCVANPVGMVNVRAKTNYRSTSASRGLPNLRNPNRNYHHNACIPHNDGNIRPSAPYQPSLPVPYVSQSYPMNSYSANQNHAVYQSPPSTSSSLGGINHISPYHHHHQNHHPPHSHHPIELSSPHHNFHQHHHVPQSQHQQQQHHQPPQQHQPHQQHQQHQQHQPHQQQPVYALTLYQAAAPPSPVGSQHNTHSGINSHHKQSTPTRVGPGRPSSALEKIHRNQKSQIQIHELTNHVCELATDSLGSRFLQERLLSASSDEKNLLFKEILSSLYQMVTNPFGNYVVQKFFELGTPEQKHTLVKQIKGQIVNLITHAKATHVIQKAIESVTLNDQKLILEELSGQVVRCSRDGNACHTLQRIIDICSSEITTDIIEDLIANTEILAEDQFGNYCIQELLEKGSPACKEKISRKLLLSILPLARHKIANNVIQKCVKLGDAETLAIMLSSLKGHVVSLATHPYGSRVIQCIIQNFSPFKCSPIIEEALQQTENLAQDSYGNFVLHQILEYGRMEDKTKLVETVCEKASLLSRHRYANILVQKCLRQMDSCQMESMVHRFKGQTSSLATHPHGCRVIQGLLEFGNPDTVCKIIFDEINDHIDDLMQNEHSNYVIQQMLDQGSAKNQTLVIEKVSSNFIPLAQNKFSTNVVQKCLHAMNPTELQRIIDSISGHVFELASHPYSVHVVQILFAVAQEDMRLQIFEEMVQENFIVPICQDQYGNYSMQHIIEYGTLEQRMRISQEIISRLFQLSCHKFASNVVTKALGFADKDQQSSFIKHACTNKTTSSQETNPPVNLTQPSGDQVSERENNDTSKMMIVAMSEDPFANYVVQKMIEVSDDEHLTLVKNTITPHTTHLCKIPYAKGVLSKLPSANSHSV